MTVMVARPQGFCAGVVRAIEIVEKALEIFGPPVYVRHEIVHNKRVCDGLRIKGARFVEDINEIPEGSLVIFSAHGVSPKIKDHARERNLKAIDATCPLVTKVHLEAIKYAEEGYEIILIGHMNHVEVQGTMGYAADNIVVVGNVDQAEKVQIQNPEKVAYITQTTLSLDDMKDIIKILQRRFPKIRAPKKEDICYATQNRQNAIKEIVKLVDIIIVVGDQESSNANRLVEVAQHRGVKAVLVCGASALKKEWFDGVKNIGVSAGASTPQSVVQEVLRQLEFWGHTDIQDLVTSEEHVTFPLPGELKDGSLLQPTPA